MHPSFASEPSFPFSEIEWTSPQPFPGRRGSLEPSDTGWLLQHDKVELPEEFFGNNCGNEKVNKPETALVFRLQLFVVVFIFFFFLSIGLGA